MRMKALDTTFNALSDPTRRAILDRLMHGEARVTEIAEPFDMSLNAVSKHIRVLEEANLVTRRREGKEHRIAYAPEPMEALARWITEKRALWNGRLDRLEALLNEEPNQ